MIVSPTLHETVLTPLQLKKAQGFIGRSLEKAVGKVSSNFIKVWTVGVEKVHCL
jgi:hypothetical protein